MMCATGVPRPADAAVEVADVAVTVTGAPGIPHTNSDARPTPVVAVAPNGAGAGAAARARPPDSWILTEGPSNITVTEPSRSVR